MKCPICGAENGHGAKVCQSCGSNMSTRGGADIVHQSDGTIHHAGDSRWRNGAGIAGAGALAGLLKFGLFFKIWALFNLVRIASFGGVGLVIGVLGIGVIVAATIYQSRRRLRL